MVMYGLPTSKRFDGWTFLFLTTIISTCVTGFLFPVHHFMPSHGVGIVSLIVMASWFSPAIVSIWWAAGDGLMCSLP